MIDQATAETTTTTEDSSSETTNSQSQETGSSTSTTDQSQDDQTKVDLAGDDTGDDKGTETNTTEEDTRTDEQKAADEERATLFGAPEGDEGYKVEGLPEGMEVDKAALDAVTPAFKELGLSNKGAAKVIQVYAEKVLPDVMARATQSIEQQVVAQRSEWEGEAEKAIKANGADLKNGAGEVLSFDAKSKDEVLKTAAKALDRLAPEGFRSFLKETGLSVHPAMVAFAYQAGKNLAEDTDHEVGDVGKGKAKSRVDKYYGS